jgi:hypothetical protein
VAIGPSHPVWSKLYDALTHVAEECGGTFAFVLDEGNGLWCVGIPGREPTTMTTEQNRAADRFYAKEVVPRMSSMRRGAPLTIVSTDGDDRYLAVTFAGIYAVVVWFEAEFAPTLVRARLRRALPEIERLTLALPPSGGPGADAGAKKMRA